MSQEQNEDLIKKEALKGELKNKLPLKDHVICGHGTLDKATAEKILREGIVVHGGYDFFNIAIPLTDQEDSDTGNVNKIVNEAFNWRHKNAKYVVLIAIPFGFRRDEVTELITIDEKDRTRIPQRFIVGFIDANEGKFIVNEKFIPNPQATEKREIIVKGKRNLPGGALNTSNVRVRFEEPETPQPVTPPPIPTPTKSIDLDDDDLW